MSDQKPEFDPSKPFEVTDRAPQGDKPEFDPSKPFSEGAPEQSMAEKVVAARPKSSYDGFTDEQLNWLQRMEKKGTELGLVKSGHEMFSPSSLRQKQLALETAGNQAVLGYAPQIIGGAKTMAKAAIGQEPDYLGDRDKVVDELAQAKGGTKAVGMALGSIPSLLLPGAAPAKTAIGGLGKAATIGGGYGFAVNPGDELGKIDPLQMGERVQNAKTGAAIGGALALPFAATRMLRERLAASPSKSADDVVRIAKGLGITEEQIPTEMLTTDPIVRDKAAALKRDPSIGGSMVRKSLKPFDDTLQNTAEGLVADAHPASETGATVGERVRTQIPQEVEGKLAPAKQAYEDLAGPMSKAPTNERAMKAGSTRLSNELAPKDSTGELRAIVDREKQHFLDNINSVEDLKKYRTDIGARSRDAYRQGNSRVGELYDNLYGILTRERDRSLQMGVLQNSRKIGGGVQAQQAVQKLKAADKLYGDTIRETLDSVGVEGGRNQSPMSAVKDHLNDIPVDQLPERLWSGKDSEQATSFQSAFPKQAEDIRKLQLQRVAKAASKGPELSPTALNNQLERMTPEAQQRLAGQNAKVLPDYRTLMKALPDPNFNPSQTNVRHETLFSGLNPQKQAASLSGAAELNLRRPLPFVKDDGVAKTMFQNPQKGLAAVAPAVAPAPPNPAKQRQAVIQKLQGTPYAAQLGQAKTDDDFALRYFRLHQTDKGFRDAMSPKPQ